MYANCDMQRHRTGSMSSQRASRCGCEELPSPRTREVRDDGVRMWQNSAGRVVPEHERGGGIVVGMPGFPAGPDPVDVPAESPKAVRGTDDERVAALKAQIAALEAELRSHVH